jgi:hypothetical protein
MSTTIYTWGLCHCSVCTDETDPAKIEAAANEQHPTGLQNGWMISKDKTFNGGQPNPCPCEQRPKTHKHYLLEC